MMETLKLLVEKKRPGNLPEVQTFFNLPSGPFHETASG